MCYFFIISFALSFCLGANGGPFQGSGWDAINRGKTLFSTSNLLLATDISPKSVLAAKNDPFMAKILLFERTPPKIAMNLHPYSCI